MGLSNSYIGRFGQDLLATWCTQASITANPPQYDERGWDFLLQFAADGAHAGPLDLAPPELSCMVQVKASSSADRSEPISLANWRRMCTDPIPWFVLAVQVDPEKAEPIAAHLVHIDESWCERALRRLRQCSRDKKLDLHNQTMNISWTDQDRLQELHGRCLRQRIVADVGDGQHTYVRRKTRWFRDLGYDDRRKRVTLTMRTENEAMFLDHMADLGVGIKNTLPPEWSASVSDVRFGIEAELDSFGPESGEIEFRPPPQGQVTMVIQTASSASQVNMLCDAYRAAAVFPFLPREYDRMRLVCGDVSVVVDAISENGQRGLSMSFMLSLPMDEVPLMVLAERVRLTRMLINHANDPVRLSLSLQDKSITLSPDHVGDPGEGLRDRTAKLAAAVDVCEHFGVQEDTIVDPTELLDQAPSAQFMAQMLEKGRGELAGPYLEPVAVGSTFGAQTEAALYLQGRTLVVVSAAWGVVTRAKDFLGLGCNVVVEDAVLVHERLDLEPARADSEHRLAACRARMRAHLVAQGCSAILDHETMRQVQARKTTASAPKEPG